MNKEAKIKFSMSVGSNPHVDQLLFAKQLDLDCVYTWVGGKQQEYEYLSNLRRKVEDAGLILWNVGSNEVGKCDKIHLALPGRDEMIEKFKTFVRNLGKAGIHTTTFTWEPTGVWTSGRGRLSESRYASARYVDLDEMSKRAQGCEHLGSQFLVVDSDAVILFYHHDHFEYVDGIDFKPTADELLVRVYVVGVQVRQVQQFNDLDLELVQQIFHYFLSFTVVANYSS